MHPGVAIAMARKHSEEWHLRRTGPLRTLRGMTITALLFASYADVLGRDQLVLTLDAGATAGDALARIRALPGGDRLPPAPLLAVNQVYATPELVLRGGDELAVIPPVAGG